RRHVVRSEAWILPFDLAGDAEVVVVGDLGVGVEEEVVIGVSKLGRAGLAAWTEADGGGTVGIHETHEEIATGAVERRAGLDADGRTIEVFARAAAVEGIGPDLNPSAHEIDELDPALHTGIGRNGAGLLAG